MPRSWVALLTLAALMPVSSCGDSTDPDGAAVPTAIATSPIEATPTGTGAPTSVSPSLAPDVVPEGFGTIAARVTASDGELCELCLWLAEDTASRGRGLMQVTDLDGLDGMAFRYDGPHTTSFTMRNTVMPLSIAFFGADGGYLGSFDMEPCVAEPCASYPTPADFMVAIEVPQGGLSELAITAGSTLELLADGCPITEPP
jgi:uncharacterized protein